MKRAAYSHLKRAGISALNEPHFRLLKKPADLIFDKLLMLGMTGSPKASPFDKIVEHHFNWMHYLRINYSD